MGFAAKSLRPKPTRTKRYREAEVGDPAARISRLRTFAVGNGRPGVRRA
jgi:hypothetical protein